MIKKTIKQKKVVVAKPISAPTKKKTINNRYKFKVKVLMNIKRGFVGRDALIMAAKEYKIKVTPSMKLYPHSFIHAFRKTVILKK